MKTILIVFIKFYRMVISPLFPDSCRFYPSCSQYAIEAIGKFGAIKGMALAMYRILRCNPFCRGGYDPVPEKFTFKRVTQEKIDEEEKHD
jgi:putative membrane protein insertion efficiency factor